MLQARAGKNPITALISETTKPEFFFDGTKATKNAKIAKRTYAFKNYAYSYNVVILNFFNPQLQFKNTESAIKNKLQNLLNKFRGSKFVITLVI